MRGWEWGGGGGCRAPCPDLGPGSLSRGPRFIRVSRRAGLLSPRRRASGEQAPRPKHRTANIFWPAPSWRGHHCFVDANGEAWRNGTTSFSESV